MWLQTRMFLLVAALFAILYGIITAVGYWLGAGNVWVYLILGFILIGVQYIISPYIVSWTMRIKWVTAEEEPELHRMVAEIAQKAGLPKPKIGISQVSMPNAFAFGRTKRDSRVCVTKGILEILNKEELKAVLGHEMSHVKHRDMMVITLLSVVPLIMYWIAWNTMWSGGRKQRGGEYTVLIGILAFLAYFVSNLLVLYGSRIREYYADKGSVKLGNRPQYLATALYKLSYSNKNRSKQELKKTDAVKAFFVTDPTAAWREVNELSQVDRNRDGVIDSSDLMDLRVKKVKLGFSSKFAELFMTHPNMLKRIKFLAMLQTGG